MLKRLEEGARIWHKISFSCPVFLQPAFFFLFSLRRPLAPTPLGLLIFFFPTTADRNSQPLTPHKPAPSFPLLPGQRQTRALIIFLSSLPAGLIFFHPSAARNKGQPPLLQSQTGAAPSLSSHSLPATPKKHCPLSLPSIQSQRQIFPH